MAEELSLILKVILALIPILSKDEIKKLTKQIAKLEKEWTNDETLFWKALNANPMDFDSVNNLLAKYFHRMPK